MHNIIHNIKHNIKHNTKQLLFFRQRALQLCNWDSNFDISNVNTKFIEQLESKHKWSRAAAISIFYYRIKRAIQTLKKASELSKEKGGDPYLGPISVALSGYSKDKNLLWKEMCLNFRHQLTDSYLKAIFTFLTCDNDSYSEILVIMTNNCNFYIIKIFFRMIMEFCFLIEWHSHVYISLIQQ